MFVFRYIVDIVNLRSLKVNKYYGKYMRKYILNNLGYQEVVEDINEFIFFDSKVCVFKN